MSLHLDNAVTCDDAIARTKNWLTASVIKHRFCPYAKQPFDSKRIEYHVYTGDSLIPLLEEMTYCCIQLDTHPTDTLETTLFIVVNHQGFLSDFYDYLDTLDMANALLDKPHQFVRRFSDEFTASHAQRVPISWRDDYQLASFHPDYVFAGAGKEDRANYTNRSPYPIFHILRHASIDKVRMDDDKADRIVERNMQCLQDMSDKSFHELQRMANRMK